MQYRRRAAKLRSRAPQSSHQAAALLQQLLRGNNATHNALHAATAPLFTCNCRQTPTSPAPNQPHALPPCPCPCSSRTCVSNSSPGCMVTISMAWSVVTPTTSATVRTLSSSSSGAMAARPRFLKTMALAVPSGTPSVLVSTSRLLFSAGHTTAAAAAAAGGAAFSEVERWLQCCHLHTCCELPDGDFQKSRAIAAALPACSCPACWAASACCHALQGQSNVEIQSRQYTVWTEGSVMHVDEGGSSSSSWRRCCCC